MATSLEAAKGDDVSKVNRSGGGNSGCTADDLGEWVGWLHDASTLVRSRHTHRDWGADEIFNADGIV